MIITLYPQFPHRSSVLRIPGYGAPSTATAERIAQHTHPPQRIWFTSDGWRASAQLCRRRGFSAVETVAILCSSLTFDAIAFAREMGRSLANSADLQRSIDVAQIAPGCACVDAYVGDLFREHRIS